MKNFIKYSLITAVIVLIVIGLTNLIKIEYKAATNEDIITEMLQIQAKAKLEFEKYHVNNENGLKGEKIENAEYGIEEEGNFFKWTKDTLNEVGQTQTILQDGEYYIINYDTEEVIYSEGIKLDDGNTYKKLSEIEKYTESKEKEEVAEEEQKEETNSIEEQEPEQTQGEETNEGEGNTET